ncbi:MAG: YceI family protein [Acidimicrobiales bacterium]
MNAATRRWALRLGVPIAVLAVLVVGGPFVYIHFISSKAPARFSLPASAPGPTSPSSTAGADTSSAGGAATPVDGTWRVVGGSQAGYRVKEVLFGQDNEAVGRTGKVSGTFAVSGTTVQSGTVSVDLRSVTSNESRRDAQFQGRIMSTSTYPTAAFTLTQPIDVANIPADGVDTKVAAVGQLAMHGTTKAVTADLTVRRTGATVAVTGTIPVKFSDWNIPNPSFSGITTQDNGSVEFLLNLSHA